MKLAGGLLAVTTGILAGSVNPLARPDPAGAGLRPASMVLEDAANVSAPSHQVDIHLAMTDGWVTLTLPGSTAQPAPGIGGSLNAYIAGLQDVSGLAADQISACKGRAQAGTPPLWLDEAVPSNITLSNLGLAWCSGSPDAARMSFAGFGRRVLVADQLPDASVPIPSGRSLVYTFLPSEPGTQLFRCHCSHPSLAHGRMAGILFVRPRQNRSPLRPGERYAYDDGDGSTRYDREFAMILDDVWPAAAQPQPEHAGMEGGSPASPRHTLLNGRVYPDTLAPAGSAAQVYVGPAAGPVSSLVSCNVGDRVLLRFVNLSSVPHAMTIDGLPMHVVGRNAAFLRRGDGTDLTFLAKTIFIGPGESYDAIFTAPETSLLGFDRYLLHDRKDALAGDLAANSAGRAMTQIHVHPRGTLPPQAIPHT